MNPLRPSSLFTFESLWPLPSSGDSEDESLEPSTPSSVRNEDLDELAALIKEIGSAKEWWPSTPIPPMDEASDEGGEIEDDLTIPTLSPVTSEGEESDSSADGSLELLSSDLDD